MTLVVFPHTFVDGVGHTASGEQVMDNLNAAKDVLNGGITSDNIAAGGVAKSDLAADALNAFLKLATGADHKVNFGVVSSGGFGSTNHKEGTITHGLGGQPTVILLTAYDIDTSGGTGGFRPVAISVSGVVDTNTFSWRARIVDTDPLTVSANGINISWLVIV